MKYLRGLALIAALSIGLFCLLLSGADDMESEASINSPGKPVGPKAEYAEGVLLVRMKKDVSDGAAHVIHARIGAALKSRLGRNGRLDLVSLPKGLTVERAIERYRESKSVERVQPNYIYHATAVPDDPRFGSMWNLHNTGTQYFGSIADADIDAPEAWDITTGNRDIVIGVIDTGIDYNHADLSANMWLNSGEIPLDGVDNDGNGYVDDIYGINAVTWNGDPSSPVGDPFDDDSMGHGTHVSGTIGAVTDNGTGVAGINWNVQLMALKFLDASGSGFTSDAVECLEYAAAMAADGVNIVATNNSWGSSTGILDYDPELRDAIDLNRQQEILFIAAAGNFSEDNDLFYFLPGSYFLPNIISVAGTRYNDDLISYSHVGKTTVHLGAPGYVIWSTVPGGLFDTLTGTSMSTAHVTGVVGLVKAQQMTRDWISIRNLLLTGGDDNAALSDNTVTGKRLNAHGSLSCSGTILLKRLKPTGAIVNTIVGREVPLAALHINCDAPAGDVSVTVNPGGQMITLLDLDDASTFQVADDGVYTGGFTPAADGIYTLDFGGVDSVQLNARTSSNPNVLADAGPDQNVDAGQQNVTLDGSASFGIGPEFQPGVISYLWQKDPSNPFNVTLLGSTTATPTFNVPTWTGGSETVNLIFTLTVSQGADSVADSVSVFVTRPASNGGGGGGGGGGCFIATAAYGSENASDVVMLRQFRDRYLLTNIPGRLFVRLYYRFSPGLASFIAVRPGLRKVVRVGLTPFVVSARLALVTTLVEKLLLGSVLSLLLAAVLVLLRKGCKPIIPGFARSYDR